MLTQPSSGVPASSKGDGPQSTAHSYDHGVCAEPFIGRTVQEHLEFITSDSPTTEALVGCQQDVRMSYEQLFATSDELARSLMHHGIERGDRIGIWSTNNCDWFTIFLAAAKIGAILVNINPAYKTSELEYVLNQSGVKLLFSITTNRTSNYLSMLEELAPHLFSKDKSNDGSRVKGLENIVVIQEVSKSDLKGKLVAYAEFLKDSEKTHPLELSQRRQGVQFDDPVNIQYTSGTTGFPKGVTLSHHNLINNAYLAAVAMRIDRKSRFCVPMPFYHCGGMISSALATLSVGGTVVIPSPFFQELPTLEAIQKERCTHVSGVPTMFIAQIESPEFSKFDLSSLRSGFMAGAPCPVQLMKRVASEMHVEDVVILYGLTESAPLMTCTTVNDTMETRATTVGRVIPGVELKIVDTETGKIVPRGTQGEICCRGHNVMLGYWNNEAATKETIDKSGWLHSGDLAVMNAQGYVNITGRKKDMICRGGENVYPREVEEVLHTHPDVSQAQVFGLPDANLGEEVALWVMVRQGRELDAETLRLWLKERVAHFKVPKYIKVVDEFPMTVTGKIQKFVMRERMVEELGLQSAADIKTA